MLPFINNGMPVETRTQLKDYCLRRLGHPSITVDVETEQLEDRIDDAIQYCRHFHYDMTTRNYLRYELGADDVARFNTEPSGNYITLERNDAFNPSEEIEEIVRILPLRQGMTSGYFSAQYQLHFNDIYNIRGGGGMNDALVNYVMTQQYISLIDQSLNGYTQIRYNKVRNRVYLDTEVRNRFAAGDFLIFEVYQNIRPEQVQRRSVSGAVTGSSSAITLTDSTGIEAGDWYRTADSEIQINSVSGQRLTLASGVPEALADGALIDIVRVNYPEYFDNMFLKDYAAALVKQQWGQNLVKFGGIQLPGGIELNGQDILDQAKEELEQLRSEETRSIWEDPTGFYTG